MGVARVSLLTLLMSPVMLYAQMPPGWITEKALGNEQSSGSTWFGTGFWAADRHGPSSTLVQSLGYGNALTGAGFMLEAGTKTASWDLAGQVLLFRDTDHASRASIQQGHALFHSEGGWLAGLEKEPLTWGYGLNGGYLLGEAARPFPRMRVQSPYRDLDCLGIPLGTWSFQSFLGKLESRRALSEDYQSPSYARRLAQSSGEPQGPMLSGFRFESRFGENTEFYANWLVLFGGNRNGMPMTQGYGVGDYLTAFLGIKDVLAEANKDNGDQSQNGSVHNYVNNARSSSNADVGVRVRLSPLEQLFGAEDVRFYVSRGSKGVNFNYKVAWHKPLYYAGKDVQSIWPPTRLWNQTYHYYSPTPQVPNDCLGLTMAWERFRLGVEYLDTVNTYNQWQVQDDLDGYRSFYNDVYSTGFYYQGDPLGSGLGGEARYVTVRAEWDVTDRLSLQTWLQSGQRPFRDANVWHEDHPGKIAADTSFHGLQQKVHWKVNRMVSLDAGCSWQHQNNVGNIQGDSGNGFRWFTQLSWRWLK